MILVEAGLACPFPVIEAKALRISGEKMLWCA